MLIAALPAALLLIVVLPPPPLEVHPSARRDPLVVAGAFHVHTARSDGGGPLDTVAEAAAAAGLSFVVVTDHGDGRGVRRPVYLSGVLCIDGAEISTSEGHVAAVGLKPAEYPLGGEARDVVEDIHRLGGMAVVTHPTSAKRQLAWSAWEAPFDGIEWLNGDSQWRDEGAATLARAAGAYIFRPAPAIALTFDRPVAALARADEAAARRSVTILAGHDAHGRIALKGEEDYGTGRSVPLPSYRAIFHTFAIRAVLDSPLTGSADDDAAIVTRALRHGRVFTAIDALATPARFEFLVRSGTASAGIGDRIIPAGPLDFSVRADAPAGARIVLLHDGRPIATASGAGLQARMPPVPGAYRVEVRIPDAPGTPPVPWIVSSPLFVGLPGRALTPVRLPGRTAAELSRAADADAWGIEHSPESTATVAASREDGSVQFAYALGADPTRSPFAALSRPVSLTADTGALEFRIQADRPMRLSVQWRSSAGGGEGLRWRRSVAAGPDERLVRLEIDRFRAVPPASGPLSGLDVDSLLFVADTVNADPGSAGSITLRDVRLLRH